MVDKREPVLASSEEVKEAPEDQETKPYRPEETEDPPPRGSGVSVASSLEADAAEHNDSKNLQEVKRSESAITETSETTETTQSTQQHTLPDGNSQESNLAENTFLDNSEVLGEASEKKDKKKKKKKKKKKHKHQDQDQEGQESFEHAESDPDRLSSPSDMTPASSKLEESNTMLAAMMAVAQERRAQEEQEAEEPEDTKADSEPEPKPVKEIEENSDSAPNDDAGLDGDTEDAPLPITKSVSMAVSEAPSETQLPHGQGAEPPPIAKAVSKAISEAPSETQLPAEADPKSALVVGGAPADVVSAIFSFGFFVRPCAENVMLYIFRNIFALIRAEAS